LLLLLLVGALTVPATAGAQVIERAADELGSDNVYVDPSAEAALTSEEEERIKRLIADRDAGPLYVAVLPSTALAEAGGSIEGVGRELVSAFQRDGVYALAVGRRFTAGTAGETGLAAGTAARLADDALRNGRSLGLAGIFEEFVAGVARAKAGEGPTSGGGGSAVGLLVIVGVIAAAVATLSITGRRRRRREVAAQMEDLHRAADEDRTALGEDLRALDLDVEMPDADPAAKQDYATALSAHERSGELLRHARTPEDFEPITQQLEEGRWAMEASKARLAGNQPPERRPPCFFDPRHGPSAREVDWAPAGGVPRLVPACEADAQRIERGEDPHAREFEVRGQRTPWYDAPGHFAPYAGGFYGGFGGPGFFGGLLAGGLLGSAFSDPDPSWGGDPGGDWGGGGDFGGADFGGGGDF
jgi:hypothetical protein